MSANNYDESIHTLPQKGIAFTKCKSYKKGVYVFMNENEYVNSSC